MVRSYVGGHDLTQIHEVDVRHHFDGLTGHWIARIVLGLASGLVIVLAPAIQYRVVLLLLQRRGLVPARLQQFLEYVADHTVLKRRGDTYLFVRELLLTYFVDLMAQKW